MKSEADKRTEQLLHLMFSVGRRLRDQTAKHKHIDPATHLQIHVLHFLTEIPKTSMRQLANFLMITPASATSLVNRLISQGLVRRQKSPADRRTVYLSLTPKGLAAQRRHMANFHKIMSEIFSRLSPKSQEQLINILKEL